MRILIVDDEEINRDVLAFILEDEGHQVLQAKNGTEACAMYATDKGLDLVLMDVEMPGMDGLMAAREMKKMGENRFVPVIFVTSFGDAAMLSKCLEAGGDDFVPKPVNEQILLARINAHQRSRLMYNNLKIAHAELDFYRRQVEREHAIVENIFARQAERVKTECCNVTPYTSPASSFDGDLVLSCPSPSGGIYVLIGDFTGHGLASSIGSLPVSEVFFNLAETQASIAEIAREINKRVFELLPRYMFFCATLLYMDAEGKNLFIWSGGMNDMLVYEPESKEISTIAGTHMPFGVLSPEEFDDSPTLAELPEGADLFVFTDGVNEAQNAEGEFFGFERIHNIIRENSAEPILAITNAVRAFCAGTEQSDDISIVKLRIGPVVHRWKGNNELVDISDYLHSASCFPWTFGLRVQDADLQNVNIVNQVMDFVGSIRGMELHQHNLFTIVSELYNNALEHGVLGLDSTIKSSPDGFDTYYLLRSERLLNPEGHFISLNFAFNRGEPNSLHFRITDSGDGFDVEKIRQSLQENENPFGRGLGLLESLCTRLEYSDGGRTALAVYELKQHH